jgi:ABC-type phosphate transport system substrate-binding protein
MSNLFQRVLQARVGASLGAFLVASLGVGHVLPVDAATRADFKLIVHPSVAVTKLTSVALSELFLKKSARWPEGLACVPVDQRPNAAARLAFTEVVHHKSVAAIESYWQKRIFSGQGVPPLVKESDEAVVAFVSGTPGAVGYISAATEAKGVKVVDVE